MPEDKDKNQIDYSEFIKDFVEEGEELLEKLNEDTVRLEKDPANAELVNEIFRSIHTLKATAGFLEITPAKDILQATESVLDKIRDGRLKVTDKIIDAIFGSLDLVRQLIESIAKGEKKEIDVTKQVAFLKKLAEAGVEVEVEKKEEVKEVKKKEILPTIRVDTKRIDMLMNLVGELVTARNRLVQIARTLGSDELDLAADFINDITNQLQSEMLRLRTVPISRIFNRFPRLVRDLSHQMKKEIALKIEGEETGLDKTVIEEIYDPLVHLVRNSVSHGIELPEERKKKDKTPQGTIRIAAYHEQNFVVIEVEDDGQGIDGKVVLDNALRKGIITQEEKEELSPEDAINLIFRPGFSVEGEATEVSGRGVGLDVVKNNIERLNGTVSVQTEPGIGTSFTAKVPLTLAILSVLEIKVSTQVYAIPLPSVQETINIPADHIKTVKGQEIISYRGEPLPLVRLDEVFGLTYQRKEVKEAELAVILESVGERIGIIVDDLLGKEEIVIKPLGRYLGEMEGVAGTTVLGTGEVILILDVPSLFKLVKRELTLTERRSA